MANRMINVINMQDYERIFKVIYTLIYEKTDPSKSCLYFSYIGAEILKKYYNLDAKPVAGLAAYYIQKTDELLVFGEMHGNEIVSSPGNFHGWIEINDIVIDFMAPIIGDSLNVSLQPLMFQNEKNEMSQTVNDLDSKCNWYFSGDDELTVKYFKFDIPEQVKDLVSIAMNWYACPPAPLPVDAAMLDSFGKLIMLELKGPDVIGCW